LVCKGKKRFPPLIRIDELSQILIRIAEKGRLSEYTKEVIEGAKKLTQMDSDPFAKQIETLLPGEIEPAIKEKLKRAQEMFKDQWKDARLKIVELESWFDNMTDRISERFTTHSKMITVIASIFVAFALQLNALDLLDQVYTNPELRAQMLASTEYILQQGNEIIGAESVYDLAIDALPAELNLPERPGSFKDETSAKIWLQENISSEQNVDEEIEKFQNLFQEKTKERLGDLGIKVLDLKGELAQMGFRIINVKYLEEFRRWSFSKFVGILVSIGLLSLGSPFWFNILKNLTNLRTRLMKEEEKERMQRRKHE
jgi:hypothetical protein